MTGLNSTRRQLACLGAALLLTLSGCQAPGPGRGSQGAQAPDRAEPQAPRLQASRALTGQARTFLEQDDPEEALRLLERAVSLTPQDGETCYWLAEAWILKDDPAQALEYHRLAGRYLHASPDWPDRLAEQKARIAALLEE